MKYKHVFFTWLLANAFLATGLVCFTIYLQFEEADRNAYFGMNGSDWVMCFYIILYGLLLTIPSLVSMLFFHFIYTKNAKAGADHRGAYIALIIAINILYLLIGQFGYGMTGEFNYFYIASTAAGLLSFYLVDRKVKNKLLSSKA
jgi:hypothetical protein